MKRLQIFISLCIFLSSIYGQSSFEICDNAIDDDGNGQIDEACASFPCNGQLYQTIGSTLNSMTLGPVKFTEIKAFSHKLNGTGYNPADNKIYSFLDYNGTDNYSHLVRIDKNGDYVILGQIEDEDGIKFSEVFAADFGMDGTFYVVKQTSWGGGALYALDIETLIAKKVVPTSERMTDIAFNPTNQKLYGISDGKYLHELDPIAGTDKNLGKLTGFQMNNGSVGATYFTLTGELLTYGVYVGYDQDDLVFIDIENVTATMKQQNAIANQSMDGCSCPYTIKLEKTVSDTMVEAGSTFSYTLKIHNRTGFEVTGVDFNDTLDTRLSITSILSNEFGMLTTGTGVGTNLVEIKNITVPVGTLSLEVEVLLAEGSYCPGNKIPNQAHISNIPAIDKSFLVSDDPTTVLEYDTTWVKIKPNIQATPGTLSIDDFALCRNIDTTAVLSGHIGALEWQESSDGQSWQPYSGIIINDTTINIIQTQDPNATTEMQYRAKVYYLCDTQYVSLKVTTTEMPVIDLGEDIELYKTEYLLAGWGFDSYTWNTGETLEFIQISTAGEYSVTITKDGCSNSDTVVVTIMPPMSLNTSDTTICKGDSITLKIDQDGYFSWHTATNQLSTEDSIRVAPETTTEYFVRQHWLSSNYLAQETFELGVKGSIPDLTQTTTLPLQAGEYSIESSVEVQTSSGIETIVGRSKNRAPMMNIHTTANPLSTIYQTTCYVYYETSGVSFWIANKKENTNPEIDVVIENNTYRVKIDNSTEWKQYFIQCQSSSSYFAVNFEIKSIGEIEIVLDDILFSTFDFQYREDTINVVVQEVANTYLGNDTTICTGASITLSTTEYADNCVWNTGATTNEITVSTAGLYIVSLQDSVCPAIDSITVSVLDTESPILAIETSEAILCTGSMINAFISDSLYLGDTAHYAWTINDILVSEEAVGFSTDTLSADAEIKLMVTSARQCVDNAEISSTKSVQVIQTPELILETGKIWQTICAGEPAIITASLIDNAASAPLYSWYLNNIEQSETSATFTTTGLNVDDILEARVSTTSACFTGSELVTTVTVKSNPNPEFLIPDIACLSNDPLRIDITNKGLHEGDFTISSTIGIETIDDTVYFNQHSVAQGIYAIEALWTDTLGCSATAFHEITIHDIETPTAETSYVTINGKGTPEDFSAIPTTGTIHWFDENMKELSAKPTYTPTETCATNECIFTYFVTQQDQVTGCHSKAVKITHTISGCIVPMPSVTDEQICFGQTIPPLSADTASLADWYSSKPNKKSTLFWYNTLTTNYNNYIKKNGTEYATGKSATGFYTYWVRQYSPGYDCYSAAQEISLEIWEAPAPTTTTSSITICETQAALLMTMETTTNWYSDAEGTKLEEAESNVFTPEVNVGENRYYAGQTQDGCASKLLEFTVFVNPTPAPPIVNDTIGCKKQKQHMLIATSNEGARVLWFDQQSIGSIEQADTLYIVEDSLVLGENTYYAQSRQNNCTSEKIPVKYTLLHTPLFESFSGDTIFCEGSDLPTFSYSSTNSERIKWFDGSNDSLIYEGDQFTIADSLGFGVYKYGVVGQLQACALDTFAFTVRVIEAPRFAITGDNLFCEQTIGEEYSVLEYNRIDKLSWSVTGDRDIYAIESDGLYGSVRIDWYNPGIDTIYAHAANEKGCTWDDSLIVAVGHPTETEFESTVDNGTMTVDFINTSEELHLEDSILFVTDFWWHFEDIEDSVLFQPYPQFASDSLIWRKYPYGYHKISLFSENNFGCYDSVSHKVFVDLNHGLFVPDAFQPSSEWKLLNCFRVVGYNLATFQLTIYDNWGNIIWHTDKLVDGSPVEFWDGTLLHQDIHSEVYIWKIQATFLDGTEWKGEKLRNGKYRKYGNLIVIQ